MLLKTRNTTDLHTGSEANALVQDELNEVIAMGEEEYTSDYIATLEEEAFEARAKLASGECKAFDDIDQMFLQLES